MHVPRVTTPVWMPSVRLPFLVTRLRRTAAFALAILILLASLVAAPRPASAQAAQPSPSATPALAGTRPAGVGAPGTLSAARSWGYQLQGMVPSVIAASPYDLVVIDYSRDGTEDGMLRPAEIAQMKVKPDGTRRLVICYLSIGEAESYRYYWAKRWSWMHWGIWRPFWRLFGERLLPAWLGPQNAEWKGNYAVRYWHPGWQDLMINGPRSYLERIIAAGFDGVYLDKIDQFVDMAGENPNSRLEMIAFVDRLAKRARAIKPGFLVVPQNGEELLVNASYRALIDGLGKEDLLYGEPKDKVRNAPPLIARNAAHLQLLLADRKPVFAVEYLRDPTLIDDARRELAAKGFVPHFADRDLETLRIGDIPTLRPERRRR
jgi:cysteinyl-tRNA synthetase, unknown class